MQPDVWTAASLSLVSAVELALVDQHGLQAVTKATHRWLVGAVRRYVDYVGHEPAVEQVAPREVAAWVRHELDRGLAATSVNSNLRAMKTLYSRLQRNGVVGFNPAEPVPFVPEPPPDPKAIAKEDYLLLRSTATNSRDVALLDVLWSSGCRLGGLLSMRLDRMERWHDDQGRECFALYVVEKFDKPRWVYVGREKLQGDGLTAWLAERPQTSLPWLWLAFETPPRRMASQTVESVLRKLRKVSGIPSVRPTNAHAFRHAFAIRMLDEGNDLAAVSAWLGHHSPEFTAAVYAVRAETELRRKMFG